MDGPPLRSPTRGVTRGRVFRPLSRRRQKQSAVPHACLLSGRMVHGLRISPFTPESYGLDQLTLEALLHRLTRHPSMPCQMRSFERCLSGYHRTRLQTDLGFPSSSGLRKALKFPRPLPSRFPDPTAHSEPQGSPCRVASRPVKPRKPYCCTRALAGEARTRALLLALGWLPVDSKARGRHPRLRIPLAGRYGSPCRFSAYHHPPFLTCRMMGHDLSCGLSLLGGYFHAFRRVDRPVRQLALSHGHPCLSP
jgi:hypothetical protein